MKALGNGKTLSRVNAFGCNGAIAVAAQAVMKKWNLAGKMMEGGSIRMMYASENG